MAYEETLRRVEEDIRRGDLGKARDRLHGLIRSYPDVLSLRNRLAEIYARLQLPDMAGRYWYLESEPTEEAKAAIATFERSVRCDPLQILQALKFRGDISMLPDHAREKLIGLQEKSRKRYGGYPRYGRKDKPVWIPRSSIKDRIMPVACIVLVALAVLLMIVGLSTVIRWAVD